MKNSLSTELAVVIPAYRAKFLEATLESIAAQTDKRFHVYIGDDASSEPIENVAKQFQGKISLTYRHFDENLGRTSLTKQWHRCIELSREPWVWLFADDDMMEPNCVASFYKTLEVSSAFDVYRFNTIVVDGKNCPIRLNPPHPEQEN